MPIEINWEDAPAGTTHIILSNPKVPRGEWRKIEGQKVFGWRAHDNRWVHYPEWDAEQWINEFPEQAVPRPPEEAPLPNGLQWIEGATHYSPYGQGLWLNAAENTFKLEPGDWRAFLENHMGALDLWVVRIGTIARYPKGHVVKPGAPAPIAEKPQPKRQVGWWT